MSKKLPSINGLRALSVSLVILGHLSFHRILFLPIDAYPKLLRPLIILITDGHLGVNIFFVISGFLITYILLKEKEQNKSISLKNFYIRRALRIFPAYYLLLLVYFIVEQLGYINFSSASWLTSLTYTKYFNWRLDWLSAHFWSLSVEEHFYLLWPLLLGLGLRQGKRSAFAMIAIVVIFRITNIIYPISWINHHTLFLRMDALAIGCLFAIYQKQILLLITPFWKWILPFCIMFLIGIRYVPIMLSKINMGFVYIPLGEGTLNLPTYIVIGILLFYSVYGPRKIWFKFLNLKALNYIGILSYGIYLWQQFFINGGKEWVHQFPQNIFLLLLVATLSYYLIERPFLKLKNKFNST